MTSGTLVEPGEVGVRGVPAAPPPTVGQRRQLVAPQVEVAEPPQPPDAAGEAPEAVTAQVLQGLKQSGVGGGHGGAGDTHMAAGDTRTSWRRAPRAPRASGRWLRRLLPALRMRRGRRQREGGSEVSWLWLWEGRG